MQATQHTRQERTEMSALSLSDISGNFVDFLREQASANHGYAAYVADTSQVSGRRVDGSERYVAIVLPDVDASAVQKREAQVHAEVRRTEDGYPIACVMFAQRMVEVALHTVSQVFPLLHGRINVVWIFRDAVALDSHVYTEEMEQDFGSAFSVADGHRHEQDPYDESYRHTAVKVHTGFVLNGIRSFY